MIVCELNRVVFFKWLLVSLSLLIWSYSLLIIIPIFIILFYKSKLKRIDLLLLFFISFLLFDVLLGLGSLANFRYLLVLVCVVDLTRSENKLINTTKRSLLVVLICFVLYIFFNSLLVSFLTEHSLIQIVQFVVLLLFSLSCANFRDREEFKSIFDNVFNLYLVILLLSIVSFAFPEIAFARNGEGFQGVTLHPNAYGVYFSGFTALTLVLFLHTRNIFHFSLFATSIALLFLSQSRTSLFSFLLGAFVFLLFNKKFKRNTAKLFFMGIPLFFLFLLLNFQRVSITVNEFLLKGRDGSIEESFKSSRGFLFDSQISNIKENLFFGIGFKVPSEKTINYIENSDFIHYEKGDFFLSCAEELGLVGLGFMTMLIYLLFVGSSKLTKFYLVIPITLLITLNGESTLFSIGGLGVYYWFCFFIIRGKHSYDNSKFV